MAAPDKPDIPTAPRVVPFPNRLPFGGKGPDNTGGEPPGGDMLERVKHLEEDMREVKTDLKALRSDVSELKGRVAMLPGYGGIALIVGVMIAISTAVQVAARFIPPAGP